MLYIENIIKNAINVVVGITNGAWMKMSFWHLKPVCARNCFHTTKKQSNTISNIQLSKTRF